MDLNPISYYNPIIAPLTETLHLPLIIMGIFMSEKYSFTTAKKSFANDFKTYLITLVII
jgi:hypothetical protein